MKLKIFMSLSSAACVASLLLFRYFRLRYFGYVFPYYHLHFPATLEFNSSDGTIWTHGMWISAVLTIAFGVTTVYLLARNVIQKKRDREKTYFTKRTKIICGISVLFSWLYSLMHLPSPLSSWGLFVQLAGHQTQLNWVPLLTFDLLYMTLLGLVVGVIAEHAARLLFGR